MGRCNPCPGWNLRDACVTIGIWSLIFSLIQMAIFGWQTSVVKVKKDKAANVDIGIADQSRPGDRQGSSYFERGTESQEVQRFLGLFVVQILNIIVSFFLLVSSIALIIGIYNTSKYLVWPWFPCILTSCLCSTVYCVLWWTGGIESYWLVLTIIEISAVAINLYCFLCVIIFYRRMVKEIKYGQYKGDKVKFKQHFTDDSIYNGKIKDGSVNIAYKEESVKEDPWPREPIPFDPRIVEDSREKEKKALEKEIREDERRRIREKEEEKRRKKERSLKRRPHSRSRYSSDRNRYSNDDDDDDYSDSDNDNVSKKRERAYKVDSYQSKSTSEPETKSPDSETAYSSYTTITRTTDTHSRHRDNHHRHKHHNRHHKHHHHNHHHSHSRNRHGRPREVKRRSEDRKRNHSKENLENVSGKDQLGVVQPAPTTLSATSTSPVISSSTSPGAITIPQHIVVPPNTNANPDDPQRFLINSEITITYNKDQQKKAMAATSTQSSDTSKGRLPPGSIALPGMSGSFPTRPDPGTTSSESKVAHSTVV